MSDITPSSDPNLLIEQPDSRINGIGKENIHSFMSYMIDETEKLPNAGQYVGESRILTNTFGRLQLHGKAVQDMTIPAEGQIVFALQALDSKNANSTTDANAWVDYATLATIAPGAYKKGQTLFKWGTPIEPKYHRYRLVVTTTFDASAFSVVVPIEEFF